LCTPTPFCTITVLSLPPSLHLKKKEGRKEREREREKEKENRREYPDLKGVASPSSSGHGGVGLDSFHRHTEPSTKTSKAGFMMVVDYAACRVPADPALPRLGEDTWCPSWHSMGGDSVRHHTSSSTHCYSIMASSCTM
jgi:hypothetical protein